MSPYEYGYYSAMKVAGLERLKNMLNQDALLAANKASREQIGMNTDAFFRAYEELPNYLRGGDANPMKARQMADRMAGAHGDLLEGVTAYSRTMADMGQAQADAALARGLLGGGALGAGGMYHAMRDE